MLQIFFFLSRGKIKKKMGYAKTTNHHLLSEVVFAALSSVGLGGETLGARTMAGGLLILAATLLASLPTAASAHAARAPGESR